jgi:hypothetical protein
MSDGFQMKLPLSSPSPSQRSRAPSPPLAFCLALATAGCAGQTAALPGVPVHPLMTETLRLHGTASPTLLSTACSATAPAKPANVLELSDDTRVTILLGPQAGEPALPVTMLHLTHLESNRTWCVTSRADGAPASIGAELPSGQYAVSVAEVQTAAPRKYEVRVLRM